MLFENNLGIAHLILNIVACKYYRQRYFIAIKHNQIPLLPNINQRNQPIVNRQYYSVIHLAKRTSVLTCYITCYTVIFQKKQIQLLKSVHGNKFNGSHF